MKSKKTNHLGGWREMTAVLEIGKFIVEQVEARVKADKKRIKEEWKMNVKKLMKKLDGEIKDKKLIENFYDFIALKIISSAIDDILMDYTIADRIKNKIDTEMHVLETKEIKNKKITKRKKNEN